MFKKIIPAIKFKLFPYKKSYSQCGEDLLISRALREKNITKPYYLDIGANDPVILNNTYYFYKTGAKGILVEPDLFLSKKISKKRPKDLILNIGISNKNQDNLKLPYFTFSKKTFNTFSKEEAQKISKKYNLEILKTVEIPIKNINTVIKQYARQKINLLSIDIEGLDFEILKSLDFEKNSPEVICAETLITQTDKNSKNHDLINYLVGKNYIVYADTHTNTIFQKKD